MITAGAYTRWNAADKTRSMSAATSPPSIAVRSDSTRSVAVLVEWCGLNSDWRQGIKSADLR